jgi:sporulation protein YlmC with PRC-barrel domain
MRMGVITTATSLVLLTGSAFAQSSSGGGAIGSPGPAPLSSGPGATARPQPPAPNPLKMEDISKIKGTAVYDNADNKIGTVSTVLMKPESKTIDRFVIGEGGVLGVGSHYVALPIDAFSWDSQRGGFKLAKTADDLKAMPEWKEQVAEAPNTGAADAPRSGGGTMDSGGGPASTAPQPGAGQSAPIR